MNWPRMSFQRCSSLAAASAWAAKFPREAHAAEPAPPAATGRAGSGVAAAPASFVIKGKPATPPASPAVIFRNSFLFIRPSSFVGGIIQQERGQLQVTVPIYGARLCRD